MKLMTCQIMLKCIKTHESGLLLLTKWTVGGKTQDGIIAFGGRFHIRVGDQEMGFKEATA